MKCLAMCMVLVASMAMEACYCYRAAAVERVHGLYRADAAGGRKQAARFRVSAVKYFARRNSLSPAALINNRAVDLALRGRYGEAEILFREVLAEDASDAAARNNLGIIFEISGDREGAFGMYMEACRLEPGNAVFRKNFIDYADYRGARY